MNHQRYLILSISLIFSVHFKGYMQELYMPYNLKQAYEKGTRSFNGNPGDNYFQNGSSYKIKASFDPETKWLKGNEWITYHNNSRHSLDKIVLRIYQDLFKKGNPRDLTLQPEDIHDGTIIKKISINDTLIDLNDIYAIQRKGTNMILMLNKHLLPGKSVHLFLSWEFKLPEKTQRRYGTYNKTSFFVAYWYPQVAVYDDIDGWDLIDFTGTHEFYNDFCDFNIEITVPANYLVWATGDWENPDKILKEPYLSKLKAAHASNEVINIISENDSWNVSKNKKKNTFAYIASNVTDFAFAVSNNYLWDAASIKPENCNNRVMMQAIYPKKSIDFYSVVEIGKQTIKMLSEDITDICFPFQNVTAFNGSGGMEFPMMINDGDYENYSRAVYVTSHEITHMYFPFLVGINEKKYAWMDEGLVTLLPKEVEKKLVKGIFPYKKLRDIFEDFSGNEQEIPMMVPSNQLRGTTYRMHAYYRPSNAFYFLREYLGYKRFNEALQQFILSWQGKHPTPYDLFFTFNHITEENLNWYWDAWFFKPGWVDMAIENVTIYDNECKVTLINNGRLPVPIILYFVSEDNKKETITISANVWKDGNNKYILSKQINEPLKEVYIDEFSIPDKNYSNNHFIITN